MTRTRTDQGHLFAHHQPILIGAHEPDAKEAEDLVTSAVSFTLEWIEQTHGTVSELVGALQLKFGGQIRRHLAAIVTQLDRHPNLKTLDRTYVDTTLTIGAFTGAANRGRPEVKRENTGLDELFARVSTIRKSPQFVAAITFVSKVRRYAPYNNMLVFLQRPNASYWATARDWRHKFQRSVNADAIPIIMLQPKGPIMLVYELADTAGSDIPAQLLEPFAVAGAFRPEWLGRLVSAAKADRIVVQGARLGGRLAGTARRSPASVKPAFIVQLNGDHSPAEQLCTLCHELAHIYLGHLGVYSDGGSPSRIGLTRLQHELEAEAVAYIVTRRRGLTTKAAEYLAEYVSQDSDYLRISVDMIMRAASRIDRMLRTSEPQGPNVER